MNEEIVFKYFPELDARQREQTAALGQLYAEWNARINVISRKDMDSLYLHHVLHSLALVRYIRENGLAPASVFDAGCGGGFPGIPMAIAMPECRFTLCDSIAKKIKVVTEVWSRTEDLGPEYRCDYVVSRAVTELRRFVPLVRHLYLKGILYLKGGDLSEEIAACVRECRIDPRAVSVTDISGYFCEEFFESKKIICIFPQKH